MKKTGPAKKMKKKQQIKLNWTFFANKEMKIVEENRMKKILMKSFWIRFFIIFNDCSVNVIWMKALPAH